MEVVVCPAGRNFGLAVENNLTEKLACKWPSGDMPLMERLGKDPQCTWGTQWRARRPTGMNETGTAREVSATRSCKILQSSQRIGLFLKMQCQASCSIWIIFIIRITLDWMREKKLTGEVGNVVSQRWKWVGTTYFGRPLSGDHNSVLVSTPRMWSEAGVSVWQEKDHKPSVSSEPTDAVNLITGNVIQWCKSTMRGMGQDNCFALRNWGEILHFVIHLLAARLFSGSREAQEADSRRPAGWLFSLKVLLLWKVIS